MQRPQEEATGSLAAWRAEIAKVLRKMGKLAPEDTRPDPEMLLATKTYDGLSVLPLYTRENAASQPFRVAPSVRPVPEAAWDVRVLLESTDATAAAEMAVQDLENGGNSLWLPMGEGALPLGSLGTVLAKVLLDLAPIVIEAGTHTVAAAKELFAVHDARKVAREAVRGNLGADPWGHLLRTGRELDAASLVDLALEVGARYPALATFMVDATVYHEAGASDAQELAYALAAGVDYLRQLSAKGVPIELAARQVEFRYAATAEQFTTMAKLRAARATWSRVLTACGVSHVEQVQHAVTSRAMMTQRDPWVNMLRTTIAGFAAGTAGANAVTVLPFDSALGVSDAFARRMARGTQALLLEEANVGRVVDPAAGSFYVEALTQELAKAAWGMFRDWERQGGIGAVWSAGVLRKEAETTRAARAKNVARRKDPITGVSEFPNLQEQPITRASRPEDGGTPTSAALPRIRYASAFEALRDRSDAALARSGARPRVLLVTLGSVAAHTARATFISNLLQAGGIEPHTTPPIKTEDELTAALSAHGKVPVACICGTDASYTENAGWVVAALRKHGVWHVILAGKPTPLEGTSVTVDESIAAGCDALSVLTALLARLEVQP